MGQHIINKNDLDISDLKLHLALSVGDGRSKKMYATIVNNSVVYHVIAPRPNKEFDKTFLTLDAAIDEYNLW